MKEKRTLGVQKYDDGGLVDLFSDVDFDIGDGWDGEYVPPDDWGLIDQGIDAGYYLPSDTSGADDQGSLFYIPPDDWGLIDQGADNQQLESIAFEQPPNVVTVDVRGNAGSPLERAGAAIRSAFGVNNSPTQSGAVNATPIPNTNSSLVMLPNGQYAIVPTQQEAPTWQNLLKLGLGGLGALAGYKASKDARDRAEKYDDERRALVAQQNAAYGQAKQRLNLPGGYASLSPATTSFRGPV